MLRNKGPHQAEKRVLAHLPGENHTPKFTAGSNTVCQCAFARSCISVWAEPTFKEKIAAKSVKVKVRRAAMVAPCCCMAGKRCPHPALRKMLRSATWSGSNCWGSWGAAGATDDRGSEAGPGCKRNDTERSGPLGRFFRRPFGFGFGSWLSLMWFWCSIREYMCSHGPHREETEQWKYRWKPWRFWRSASLSGPPCKLQNCWVLSPDRTRVQSSRALAAAFQSTSSPLCSRSVAQACLISALDFAWTMWANAFTAWGGSSWKFLSL